MINVDNYAGSVKENYTNYSLTKVRIYIHYFISSLIKHNINLNFSLD